MDNRPGIAALLFLSLVSSSLAAQSQDTATLPTVVVSATQAPATREQLPQAVTIIMGAELRARGLTRVSDALRSVPGAVVVQNGSIGSVNTMFMRGGESRYTKVLIDGVTVNAPGGFFDFSHLTTDNIDRIEIVRGPGSVVHGADAMTGTVQIFTRRGDGPLSFSGEARSGTAATREAAVDVAGSSGPARYSLGGAARRTDGIYDFNNQYYNGTLSGSLGVTPRAGTDLRVTTRYTAAEFHYPTDFTGAPVDSNAYRVQHRLTGAFEAATRVSRSITGRFLLGTNEVSDMTEDVFQPFQFPEQDPILRRSRLFSRNKRRNVDAGLTATLSGAMRLSAGAEYVDESERSINSEGALTGPLTDGPGFSARRDSKAVYGELTGDISRASYVLSARRDDHSDYDARTTYRAGTSAALTAATRVRASVSTAFSAPAFNQLRATLYTVANPDLRPEHSRSWEVGFEHSVGNGVRVSGSYFNQRFMDLIQFVNGGPPDFLGSYDNLTEAKSNGYEIELAIAPGGVWSAAAAFTQMNPRVRRISSEYDGDLRPGDALIRRPKHTASGTVSWARAGAGALSVTATYVGERPDLDFTQFPSPVVILSRYAKVDLAASRDLIRFSAGRTVLGVTARVDNLLDDEHEDVYNFRAPGRIIVIGARLRSSM